MRTILHARLSFASRLARAVVTGACVVMLAHPAYAAETGGGAGENPLRAADEATLQRARAEAWETFQRSCSPCHGTLGGGDGPYAYTAPRTAADLRRASREVSGDAIRFKRIHDGAAGLPERQWESNMPAFGGVLDDRQIWGLVILLEDLGSRMTGIKPYNDGGDVYAQRCAVCHGTKGGGDGPLAAELLPAPSDLAHGPYRFRSTPFGAPPIENDMMISTASGLSHTAMGSFKALGGGALEDVKDHIKMNLAPALFATTPEPAPMSPIPTEPVAGLVAAGRTVYEKAGCGDCHGASGRGNGSKVGTLKDASGRPSIATDLTKRWHYKRGAGGAPDVFYTLTTGLNGTPMVSYVDSLSAEERWQVSYFLERLGRNQPRFSPTVLASVGKDEIPADPTAKFWDIVPNATVPLGPQVEHAPFWTQPSIDSVDVRVAGRGEDLGILLTWNDRTKNVRTDDAGKIASVSAALQRSGAWELPDRIAVQFPEKLDPKGSLPSSYAGDTTRTVRRWLWSADRSEGGEGRAITERVAGPGAEPETVGDAAPVDVTATYTDGQWRVLFRGKRPVKTTALPIAVQAWDGGAGESGRWQSFSSWVTVDLK